MVFDFDVPYCFYIKIASSIIYNTVYPLTGYNEMLQGHGSTTVTRGHDTVIPQSNGAATEIYPCRYSAIHVSCIQAYHITKPPFQLSVFLNINTDIMLSVCSICV
jgi:hypothetical protein